MVLLLLGHFLERFLNLLQRHAIKLIACSEKHKQITTLICDDAERKVLSVSRVGSCLWIPQVKLRRVPRKPDRHGGIVEKVKLFFKAGSDNFPAL